ncbi:MAG: ABC transporter permease, partial [Bacteroidia bacterium]|nr:ABC transporter permease [Bacteroidia bacterium]
MIRNYLRIALRNFRKQKAFTALNIIGLSIGMAASLLILQYVRYEKSYDTFHTKSDRIYRIQYNGYRAGKLNFECAAAVPAVSHALKDNFAEVEQVTRLFPVSGVVSYESPDRGLISFRERKMQITEPSVFEMFDFKLVKGDPKTSLQGPNKAVISEHAARKYFGDEDPIGKTISWDGEHNFEIAGIMADVPDNSHIKFDFLLSYQTLSDATENAAETSWGWYDFNTYVLLKP